MKYVICATVSKPLAKPLDNWKKTIQVPVFLLDGNMLGITSEDHAREIALRMLSEIAGESDEVSVGVAAIDE